MERAQTIAFTKRRAIGTLLPTLLFLTSLVSCGGGNNPAPSPAAPKQLAVWTNSFNGIPFTMVGTDPSVAGAGTTNVGVEIIPVALNFSAAGIVISPDSIACGDSDTPVDRVVNSPLFTTNPWMSFGVSLGNTQFGDAYQRANFWSLVNSTSPNYHVMLQPVKVLQTITVDVPPNIGATLSPSPTCPSQVIGGIPSSLMDSAVQNAITQFNITSDTLPIFLTYDVTFVPQNFLGYHSVQGNQSYIVASYIDVGFNGLPQVIASDVAVLSHEIGEWMNDPLLGNFVPPWGGIGIEPGCSNVLEVGDPLSANIFPIGTSSFTYHIQELAYFSWFSRNSPSLAVNGMYSTLGSFAGPAPPCP